jgi:hypothetical protein
LLIVFAEYEGTTPPVGTNLILIAIALALACLSYAAFENPIRHSRRQMGGAGGTVMLGSCALVLTLSVAGIVRRSADLKHASGSRPAAIVPAATATDVLRAVRTATKASKLPPHLAPPLGALSSDVGPPLRCNTSQPTSHPVDCVYGDRTARKTVVLFGDSHAAMWLPGLDVAARRARIKAILMSRPGCPAPAVHIWNLENQSPDRGCDIWRSWAIAHIKQLHPAMLVVTSLYFYPLDFSRSLITDREWDSGLSATLANLRSGSARAVVLGDIPYMSQSPPDCLAAHSGDIGACATSEPRAVLKAHDDGESATARAAGAAYVNVTPWFCAQEICPSVVGTIAAYRDKAHISATYSRWLGVALGGALRLS